MSYEIPKISFQIYFDGAVPEEHYDSNRSLRKNLDEFQYRTYDEAETVAMFTTYLPQYLELFNTSQQVEKKAIAAYGWLYIHGGIYVNCDMILRTPPTYIEDGSQIYVTQAHYPTRLITPHLLASVEKCEFWLNVLDTCRLESGHYPRWAQHLDPESKTGFKNFNNIAASEPLTLAYKSHRDKYYITIISLKVLLDRGYIVSVSDFSRQPITSWRRMNLSIWVYALGIFLIIIVVIMLVLIWIYESNRIKLFRLQKEAKPEEPKKRSLLSAEDSILDRA